MFSICVLCHDTRNPSAQFYTKTHACHRTPHSHALQNKSRTYNRPNKISKKLNAIYVDITVFQSFQYPSHCSTLGIFRWVKTSLLTLWFFRLLTSCSLAIKSISHCQWSWSSLDLNDKMLVLLLLWDQYIHWGPQSPYCSLSQDWCTVGLLRTKVLEDFFF